MRVMAKAADHSHSRHHHASLRPSVPSLAACDSLWSRVVTDLCAAREKCFASHVRFGLASTFQHPRYKAPLCSLDMFTNARDYKFLRKYRCLGLACRMIHLFPRRYKAATPMFTTPPQRCPCRRLEDHGYCRNLPFQNSDSNESAKYTVLDRQPIPKRQSSSLVLDLQQWECSSRSPRSNTVVDSANCLAMLELGM